MQLRTALAFLIADLQRMPAAGEADPVPCLLQLGQENALGLHHLGFDCAAVGAVLLFQPDHRGKRRGLCVQQQELLVAA